MAKNSSTIKIIYVSEDTNVPPIFNVLKDHFDVFEAKNPLEARLLANSSSDFLLMSKEQIEFINHAADALFILDPDEKFHSLSNSLSKLSDIQNSCCEIVLNFKKSDEINDDEVKWIESEGKAWEVRLRKAVIKNKIYVFALLFDRTGFRRLQQRIDAIHSAGKSFGEIDSDLLTSVDMASRLRLVEERIIDAIHKILDFDNFEIRLLNKKTNQLELVISKNLPPLEIGEVIYSGLTNNGITGHVAFTGKSYICDDVSKDPLYTRAHDHSASSITVPLFLGESVIGTLNAESFKLKAFDETDRQLTEILGRYIADAMHLLDLLLIERFTTNEKISKSVLEDIKNPIKKLRESIQNIKILSSESENIQNEINIAMAALKSISEKLISTSKGPKTILDTEIQISTIKNHDVLNKCKILIADDDINIRNDATKILEACNATITSAKDGLETIQLIEKNSDSKLAFDIILSDIRMPHRNGYEIYRTANSLSPTTKIVLMTGFGYDPHHSVIRASQEGMSSVLYKPFRAEQLIETLSSILLNN